MSGRLGGRQVVEAMPDRLGAQIESDQLSHGQRQLLCLSRCRYGACCSRDARCVLGVSVFAS